MFFCNDTPTTQIYTLSLTTLFRSISPRPMRKVVTPSPVKNNISLALRLHTKKSTVVPKPIELVMTRSEEHTSELQSLRHLVCRLLLEKKKKQNHKTPQQQKQKQQ